MANNANFVTLVGNLTRDPELRFTPNGQARAVMGLAVNRSWQNRQTNEWQEQTSFFNVVCWAELAENVAESLHKGTRVLVEGRLEQRSWEDKDSHEKRSVVEVIADEIGPSLRFATAEVKRTERREGGDGGGGGYSGGGGGGGGGARPAPNEPAGGYGNDDEEPF